MERIELAANAAEVASGVTYTGAGVSVGLAAPHYIWGLTLDEWTVLGIIFGMAMAFAGWLTNVYFKRRHTKLLMARLAQGQPLRVADFGDTE